MKLTFLSLSFPIYILDVDWMIVPGMMNCLLGHLSVSLDKAYPEFQIDPAFLLFKSVGKLLLPVSKEK